MAEQEEDNRTKLAVIQTDLAYIKTSLSNIDSKVSNQYVSKAEFNPIQRIVYGFVAIALLAIGGALINLVVTGGSR